MQWKGHPGRIVATEGNQHWWVWGQARKERGGGPCLSPTRSAAGVPVGEDPLRGTASLLSTGQAGAGQAGMENEESVL